MNMMQSQTKLHRPNLKILRGNNLYPILLKISRFGITWTISESGEFKGDCNYEIGKLRGTVT